MKNDEKIYTSYVDGVLKEFTAEKFNDFQNENVSKILEKIKNTFVKKQGDTWVNLSGSDNGKFDYQFCYNNEILVRFCKVNISGQSWNDIEKFKKRIQTPTLELGSLKANFKNVFYFAFYNVGKNKNIYITSSDLRYAYDLKESREKINTKSLWLDSAVIERLSLTDSNDKINIFNPVKKAYKFYYSLNINEIISVFNSNLKSVVPFFKLIDVSVNAFKDNPYNDKEDAFSHFESDAPLFNQDGSLKLQKLGKLKRNEKIVNDYANKLDYCELCDQRKTFTTRNGKQYFEIHHFLPYNSKIQDEFQNTLDWYSNLVSLCPTCHRKIHLSDRNEQLKSIEKLLDLKNKTNFINDYGPLSIEEIFGFYSKTLNLGETENRMSEDE